MDLPEKVRQGLFVGCMHVWTELLKAVLGMLDTLQTTTEVSAGALIEATSDAGYARVFAIHALATLSAAGLIEMCYETGMVRITQAGREVAGLLTAEGCEKVPLDAWQALQDVVETGKSMSRK